MTRIAYYAPRERMRAGDVVQAFVALGTTLLGKPYQAEAADGFRRFRRAVEYHLGTDAPIKPLLQKLSFTRGRKSWGLAFRRGTLKIEPDDLGIIAKAINSFGNNWKHRLSVTQGCLLSQIEGGHQWHVEE